jgi:hypothetical protein
MNYNLLKLAKTSLFAILLVSAVSAMAQDGTIYPLKAPAEPKPYHLILAVWMARKLLRPGSGSGVTQWRVTSLMQL